MSSVKIFIAIAILGISATVWGQYRQITMQKQVIAAQAMVSAQLEAGLASLQQINEDNRSQISELLYAQERVQISLTARNQEIRKLQHEVKEVRDWANKPLPDDIKRLLNHPATTGASGYSAAMQPSNSVHDASNQPKD